MHTSAVSPRYSVNLTDAVTAAGEPLLFGIRLWASVCLALYVAFWLQLENPFWAGTSAAIVCLPQLGASLRKGWFRMIGTFVRRSDERGAGGRDDRHRADRSSAVMPHSRRDLSGCTTRIACEATKLGRF